MTSKQVSGDLRLTIPATAGWALLVILILLGQQNKPLAHSVSILIAVVLFCAGMFSFRKFPTFGLAAFTSTGLVIAYASRFTSHIDEKPWDVQQPHSTQWWLSWADYVREGFLEATATLPSVGGELIPGLAIGDTSRMSEFLSGAMKSVSLTHITAVSGANCVIVTATIMAISAVCGAGRKLRLVLSSCVLVAFVILVTPQPSVVRAAVMAIVVMVSLFSGRPGTGLPLLAVAVIGMLLWDPWWAVEYGFILSVTATASLLLFSGPLGSSLSQWMPAWLATLIAIPLAAQLMCQPIIILLSPQLPTFGVLANILATPLAPIATILGLAICVLLWAPAISHLLLWLAWLPAEWIGQTALVLSRLPMDQIPWPSGLWGSLVCAVYSSLILTALLQHRPVVRRTAAAFVVLSFCVWSVSALVRTSSFIAALPPDWSIAACDVGQGDGLVLRSVDKIAVIDVGRKPEPMKHCLDQLGIHHIDLLVLTHFDKDHVGGLSAVIGKVDRAIVGKPENLEDQSLLRDLSRGGAILERGVQGMTGTLGETSWKVLWPDGEHPTMELGNPGSVTMLFSFTTFRAIFLGDLGKEAQQALIRSHSLPKVEVVKVAHHGSADQSETFYKELQPQIALFSVGIENDYGHPRSETLTIMKNQGALSPRTDLDGLILVSSSPNGLSVWTEH